MAQEGFKYEENAYKALDKYGISTGGVAGASSDKPDLTIKNYAQISTGCELKNSPTAAGSLVMKYFDGKWDYGSFKKDEIEKVFLYELGEKFKLLTEMNERGNAGKNWRGKIPALQNDKLGKKVLMPGVKDKRIAYKLDIEKFGAKNEVHIKVPAKAICDYYIKKKCSYINVGTHGFYTLNGKDDLDLNKKLKIAGENQIPDFAKSSSAEIRVRCQYKGSGDYQFVMTLQFGKMTKSPYNIAPIRTGSSSDIDVQKLEKDPILAAFK
jgi:hypothetical protein